MSPVWCPWCYNLEYLQITRTGGEWQRCISIFHATTWVETLGCRQIPHGVLPGKALVPVLFSFPEKWWKLDQLGSANGFLWGKWWIKSLQVSLVEVFDRLNVRYDPLLAAFATTSAAGPFFSIALGVLIVDNPLAASVGLARASPQAWLPGNGIGQSSQLCFKILYKLLSFDCADWTLSGHFKYSLVFCQTRLRRQAWEMVGSCQ